MFSWQKKMPDIVGTGRILENHTRPNCVVASLCCSQFLGDCYVWSDSHKWVGQGLLLPPDVAKDISHVFRDLEEKGLNVWEFNYPHSAKISTHNAEPIPFVGLFALSPLEAKKRRRRVKDQRDVGGSLVQENRQERKRKKKKRRLTEERRGEPCGRTVLWQLSNKHA